MQGQPVPQSHGQAALDEAGRAGGSSPQAAGQHLPHAQKYMLLHALSQQLEAGHVDHVIRQIKEELDPDFLDHHPDLLFELHRCGCCKPIMFEGLACELANTLGSHLSSCLMPRCAVMCHV